MKNSKTSLESSQKLPKVSKTKAEKELEKLLAEQERRILEAELASRSMAHFVSFTKEDYVHSHFSKAVCEALDTFLLEVEAGKRPILVIQAPPQHGKSELVSRRFVTYAFGKYPNLRIASCSYAADLARDMNRDVQTIMLDTPFNQVFPKIALNAKRTVTVDNQALRNADRFDIPGYRGYYICVGVGGPLTGKSVDIGIIDDPIKNEAEALSATVKRGILGWYNTVFLTRLSKKSGQIIMATNWATDDLPSVIAKKKNLNIKHLKFPAIDREGKALVPELHSLEKLLEVKESLSPSQFSALYQQEAVSEGGNIFKEEWFKTWYAHTLPTSFDQYVLSWDFTFKDSKSSDFVVGQLWGKERENFYLLDQVRGRMSFTASKKAISEMSTKYPQAFAKLVEDKANGPAIIDDLKNDISGLLPVNPEGSKLARAYSVTPLFAAGNVYIPDVQQYEWVRDYVEELIAFPAASHDDQVDATSQALHYLKMNSLSVWEALSGN